MITSKKLTSEKKIKHGFFNQMGGKSTGIYKSLNCGLGSKDNRNKVRKNLEIVKKRIDKKAKKIFLVNQTHSNRFIFIDEKFKHKKNKIKADAIITDQKKIPIAVLTADCAPLLLYDRKKNMAAAIHAGWKGAYRGIIKKVINFMFKKGCDSNTLVVAIGPCIKQKSYVVRENFMKKFIKKSRTNKIFFKKKKNIIYFNLSNFIKTELKTSKIRNIDTINIDTFDKKNNFFSARRSLILNHDDYGRNISIIMIN